MTNAKNATDFKMAPKKTLSTAGARLNFVGVTFNCVGTSQTTAGIG